MLDTSVKLHKMTIEVVVIIICAFLKKSRHAWGRVSGVSGASALPGEYGMNG